MNPEKNISKLPWDKISIVKELANHREGKVVKHGFDQSGKKWWLTTWPTNINEANRQLKIYHNMAKLLGLEKEHFFVNQDTWLVTPDLGISFDKRMISEGWQIDKIPEIIENMQAARLVAENLFSIYDLAILDLSYRQIVIDENGINPVRLVGHDNTVNATRKTRFDELAEYENYLDLIYNKENWQAMIKYFNSTLYECPFTLPEILP